MTRQTSQLQLSNHTQVVDVLAAIGHRPTHGTLVELLSRVPRNEIFQLHVNQKRLVIPRLNPQLSGLTITHISDLHFTGEVTEDFFREVVRQANQLQSDLIAVTGDIIDKRKCMGWLGEILGQLKAAGGVYFVLGNHDVRVHDEFGVRDALTSAGLVDLGKRWTQIDVHACPIVLAGNELPWFMPAADLRDSPPVGREDSPLRILLSHSPDQLPWAKVNDIDLMLAGHTHGGQIQLPVLGPLLSPSRFGVKYASGTFFEGPTLMHVSRGVSGTRHVRLKAPPELTQLELVPGAQPSTSPITPRV
jgi:predicted MPP superfamily phosphohydrolase